jgi:hypothetical protein
MAHPGSASSLLYTPGWKTVANWVAAAITSILFLSAGLWELTDVPFGAAKMQQALVPEIVSVPAALLLGIANTITGVFVLVPRFRRWGAWLACALLVVFMAYFAVNYTALRGEECGCFPWIKRAVGPAFFISDGFMLAIALLAGWWAKPSSGLRSAGLIVAAVGVFALVSYGVAATRQTGARAPISVETDAGRVSLIEGRFLLYFFNPECTHCLDAARRLAKLNWGDTRVIGVATEQYRFAREFMDSSGLRGPVSPDAAPLRKAFPFVDPPFAVALRNGVEQTSIAKFDSEKPYDELKRLGFAR